MERQYTSFGYIQGTTAKHYGVLVDLTKPVTGVVQNNHVPGIYGEDAIDLAWDEHAQECTNDIHDDCGPQEAGTQLIGSWKQDDKGQYDADETGEYAAILRESTTQVVWSRHTKRCAPCSPCYPGQGDLDTPVNSGGFLCYDLPPCFYERG